MDEQILAYIGKVLGNTGTMLAGNNQNLQQFGQQGAAANEGWLADIYRKEAEDKRKKEEEKGLWGDIINLGGTAASVAFPAAAPVIAPLTGVASGAVSGGTNGAISAGINSAIPIAGDMMSKSQPTQQPTQAPQQQPTTQPSFENRTQFENTNGFQGTEYTTNQNPDGTVKTMESQYQGSKVQPTQAQPQKQGFLSTLLSNPDFQSSVTGITNRLTQPDRPQINTLGLNPDTAFALTREFNDQNQRETQNRLDQEQLDIQRGRYQQEKQQYDEPKIISGTEPVNLGNGQYGYYGLQNGQVAPIPVSGYQPEQDPTKVFSPTSMVDIGGGKLGWITNNGPVAAPEGVSKLPDDNSKWRSFSGIPILENDLSALYGASPDSPEFGAAVDRLHGAMDVGQTLAPIIQSLNPPTPISVVRPSSVTQVPRPTGNIDQPITTQIPIDPVDQEQLDREKAQAERVKAKDEETTKAKEGERVTTINDRIDEQSKALTTVANKRAINPAKANIKTQVSRFEKETGKKVRDVSIVSINLTENGYTATYQVDVEGEGMSDPYTFEGQLNAK